MKIVFEKSPARLGHDMIFLAGKNLVTRVHFKQVTIQGVFATPLFSIDGLKVDGLNTFDVWKATLDPLVA